MILLYFNYYQVVVLGGSEYACFAAEGLAALGSQVSLVSTNKVSLKHKNGKVCSCFWYILV